MKEPRKKARLYRAALKIVAGIPDERGKTYGSILHGHESEFILAVLAGKSIEEAFGIVKDGDADMDWIRELADACDGDILPLDELQKLLGRQLKEPLSSTIVQERYGDELRPVTCRQCRKVLPDARLVMVVKHMIEEHGAETVDDLKMLRIGFGEKPEWNEHGAQTVFPMQLFLSQYVEQQELTLEQALKNAKTLLFMESPMFTENPLAGSVLSGSESLIEPLDLTRDAPISIAYICAACGAFAYGPADCLSIDTGTTFTCERCGGKTVVSLMTVDEYVSQHKIEAPKESENEEEAK